MYAIHQVYTSSFSTNVRPKKEVKETHEKNTYQNFSCYSNKNSIAQNRGKTTNPYNYMVWDNASCLNSRNPVFELAWRLFSASWIMFVIFYQLVGRGISLGNHRMVTHKIFEARPWFKNLLLVLACPAVQGSTHWWAARHRAHHAYSDREGDPHSTNHGFLWAHMLWLLFKYQHPKIKEFTKKDIDYDREVLRQIKYLPYVAGFAFLAPPLIGFIFNGPLGALDAFFAVGIIAYLAVFHVTMLINSWDHLGEFHPSLKWLQYTPLVMILGYQTGKSHTADRSKNSPLLAWISDGKGNHNNHHLQPAAAFSSNHWWEIDTNKWLILLLERCGVVWNVIRPIPLDAIKNRKEPATEW